MSTRMMLRIRRPKGPPPAVRVRADVRLTVSADGSPLTVQGEELLGPADAAQSVPPNRDEAASLVGGRGGEGGGHEHRLVDGSTHSGNPADFVDGGADNSEIEPIFTADVPVEHLADMETQIHFRCRRAFLETSVIQDSDRL